jgi:glycosyltransferase involved in cell wall biosynthesis
MPKVSVIIPNYNHARYLKQRIRSVLDQTYQDFEVIYLDDASTDDSDKVFAEFIDHPRIRTIYNQVNSGSPFKQWNKGISHATGKYVWIAESDDCSDPHFLETLVSILDDCPQVGLAYCQSRQIDEFGNPGNTMHWWTDDISQDRWRSEFLNSGLEECKSYLAIKNTIPNASAALVRTHFFEKIGYADESMSLCGDWMTWIKLLLESDIAFTAQELNYYRKHSASVRAKVTFTNQYLRERLQVLSFLQERLELQETITEIVKDKVVSDWLVLTFVMRHGISFWEDIDLYRFAKGLDFLIELRVLRQFYFLFSRKLDRHVKELFPMFN